eukprot:TRINITY_DN2095_c0_g1_i1.p1 TRINITY_DN2095_c0_g1~~TRINITY_DN2095_c0_g1_i1.p1  ORF type:complete len:154 (-),score=43.59 TRINITY_DN2095_c0_g1_i1:432-893(-)
MIRSSALSEKELREFREIFSLVDVDHSGSISPEELGQLMTTLGLRPSQQELDAMIREIDADGSGDIDFDEFVAVMSRKVNANYTPEEVKAAFKTFQNDCNPGFVRISDLKKALQIYGSEKLTAQQADELLAQMDPEGQDLVNYVDYVNVMSQN